MMQRKEQERRHFSRWGKGRRILSCFLSLIMVLSLLPGMPVMKAGATGEFDYSTLIPSGDALTNLQVTFNGQKWYVVGYGDKGITTESGYVTLLAADTSFGTSAFSSSMSNTYGGSTVETALKAYTDSGSFKDVADAIRTVTLSDVSNTEAKLYLLSTGEANQLEENVRKINFTGGDCSGGEWWLRSPGSDDSRAAFVFGEDGHVFVYGFNVN